MSLAACVGWARWTWFSGWQQLYGVGVGEGGRGPSKWVAGRTGAPAGLVSMQSVPLKTQTVLNPDERNPSLNVTVCGVSENNIMQDGVSGRWGGAGVSSQCWRFGAGGQLGMLSSLGISSPCCWSVCCPRLLHWSPSLPASPVLRGTWSQCRGRGWGAEECFHPLQLTLKKRQHSLFAVPNKWSVQVLGEKKTKKTTQRQLRSVAKKSHPKTSNCFSSTIDFMVTVKVNPCI